MPTKYQDTEKSKGKYMVLAKPHEIAATLAPGTGYKWIKTYDATDANDAYRQFLEEFCPDIREAQKFASKVYVIKMPECANEFSLVDTFKDSRFTSYPNPDLFGDEDYYY